MTDEDFETLLRLLRVVVAWIARVRNPRRRAVLAHRLAESVDRVNKSIGVVRQDAVRELKAEAEARGKVWRHRDTARLLGISTTHAGRIANAKLNRPGSAEPRG